MKKCLPVILIAVIAVAAGCRRQSAMLADTLPLDSNTVLHIYLVPTPEADLVKTLSYDIVRNNVSVMNGRHGFGAVPTDSTNNLSFEILKTADGTVIGVTERHNSNNVRIVYDFVSEFNWPYCQYISSDYHSDTNKARTLVKLLEIDLQRGSLTVSGQSGQLMGVTEYTTTMSPLSLSYEIEIPSDAPERIELHHKDGSTESVDYKQRYSRQHRDGWYHALGSFVQGVPCENPIVQEWGIDTEARTKGIQECETAIQKLILAHGDGKVRSGLKTQYPEWKTYRYGLWVPKGASWAEEDPF